MAALLLKYSPFKVLLSLSPNKHESPQLSFNVKIYFGVELNSPLDHLYTLLYLTYGVWYNQTFLACFYPHFEYIISFSNALLVLCLTIKVFL